MAKNYSPVARDAVHSLSSGEQPVWLLEITHPTLQPPARVCAYRASIRHQGSDFIAAPFSLKPPDDLSTSAPRGRLTINSARAMYWAERSGGAVHGARVRLLHVMPSDPDTVLIEYGGLRVYSMRGTVEGLSAEIGYGRDLGVRLSGIAHDAVLSPGLH